MLFSLYQYYIFLSYFIYAYIYRSLSHPFYYHCHILFLRCSLYPFPSRYLCYSHSSFSLFFVLVLRFLLLPHVLVFPFFYIIIFFCYSSFSFSLSLASSCSLPSSTNLALVALFRAAEEAGNCVSTLVTIANNPETRSSDRLKAIEMLFGRADKLMGFLEQKAQFPQEILQEKELKQEREKIWKLELQAAGWKLSYPHSDCWVSPQDGGEYDIGTAYHQLQSNSAEKASKKVMVKDADTRLVYAVAEILQKITRKTTEKKDISLDDAKQLSIILRNLKAVTSDNDAVDALRKIVDWELLPNEALNPLIDACEEGNSLTRERIREVLTFERN